MIFNKCLVCGSSNLRADRALSGRLVCTSCGNPYGVRKVRRNSISNLSSFSFNKKMLWGQLKLAVPMGTQECIIAFGWTFFLKIVGIIGVVELATTHIIFTIMHASFMPAMGVGMACSTLVSKHMGEEKIQKSVSSIKESVRLAEYGMGTLGESNQEQRIF